jgi:PTS system nitrogen regulatory IIA component
MEAAMQWLCPQQIELDVDVPDRREALRAVSAMIARAKGLSAPPVYRALWRREMAGSTGVGDGLAIPHARIAGITEPVTAYLRMKVPLNFAAPDGRRISELYVILVPAEGACTEHL